MADVQVHIERIREQCCRIQEDGHLKDNTPAYVALCDVVVKLQVFKDAIEIAEEEEWSHP